jgi:hypothetical protein
METKVKKISLPCILFLFIFQMNSNFAQENNSLEIKPTEIPEISGGAEVFRMIQKAISSGDYSFANFGDGLKSNTSRVEKSTGGGIFTIEGIDFDGNATASGYYSTPPDPIAAAGSTQVVSVVNTTIEWYTKAGVNENTQRLGKNASTEVGSFFESLSPLTGTFDPKVIYDQYDGRFVVVSLEQTDTSEGGADNTSRILVAVSDDDDPNGTWYFHAIDSKITISMIDHWADYPGLGLDDNAVYITANMYEFAADGGGYGGQRLWIIDKTPFYSGGAASVSVYDPFNAAGVGGFASTSQPAHMFGTAPTGVGTFLAYYSGLTDGTNEYVGVIRVDDPLGTPVFSNQFVFAGDIDITDSTSLPDAPQKDTTATVEVNDRRTLNAVWRDDFLWVSTTMIPSSGDDMGQSTAHWFKIHTATLSSLAMDDQGNVGGEDIATGTYTFMPSLAVNGNETMVIGFSASSTTMYPGAYFAGRLMGDAPGTVGASGVLRSGLDYHVRTFGGSRNRWGDYSGMSLDPSDGTKFWAFNEYAINRGTVFGGEDGRWGTAFGEIPVDVIPVELTSFTARIVDRNVELKWTTATETNNMGFDVERSINDEEFTMIGFVSGYGTVAETKSYVYVDKNISGSISYRLKQIDFDGSFTYSNVVEVSSQIEFTFKLAQNYPNPFNPETKISYSIPHEARVKLSVFNPIGEVVIELINEVQSPDFYEVVWNAKDVTSGIYFYTVEVVPLNGESGYRESKKMVLMK